MDELIKKIAALRDLAKSLTAKPGSSSLVPALKIPAPKPISMPSTAGAAPTKLPGVAVPSGKDPKAMAAQLKNPRPKKPAKMEILKTDKNGQWSLEKNEDDRSNPIAEKYLKENYGPEARKFLKEGLYDIPTFLEHGKRFSNDFEVKPVSSTPTKILTPQLTPTAQKSPSFTVDDFSGHSGWQPDIEHKYQIHHKGKLVGHLSVNGDGSGEWHKDFSDWVKKNPEINKTQKSKSYDVNPSTHVMGLAMLHHANTRLSSTN